MSERRKVFDISTETPGLAAVTSASETIGFIAPKSNCLCLRI